MAEAQITMQDTEVSGKPVKTISIAGQLDETNVDEEAKKIYKVIDEMAEPNLLLDLADLTYMNSKSIGYVTDWYSRTAAKNGKIAIARPKANILDILKVVGITQIIPIHDTLEEAQAAFGSGGAPAAKPAAPVTPAPTSSAAPPPATPAAPRPETPPPPSAPPAA
jgi:anti-sigma B factor antagonist